MNAVVMHEAGPPDVLQLEKREIPKVQSGQVLIRVKAFGLNRSEAFTRARGRSPIGPIQLPRILGVEATGIVEEAPGREATIKRGDIVATAMGGVGRDFDGGYAEYVCVPADLVVVLHPPKDFPWSIIGALPQMMETVWGGLFTSLKLEKSDRLLIRGGTTSVGLAAAAVAKNHGCFVASTTRNPEYKTLLLENGADQVFIDDGAIAAQIKQNSGSPPFTKLLEFIGAAKVKDSLQCVSQGGIICELGLVGPKLFHDNGFSTFATIPSGVYWTTFKSTVEEFRRTPYDSLMKDIAERRLVISIGKVFEGLDKVVEAHKLMEDGAAAGKIVITL